MGSHHDAVYEALFRCHLADLDRLARRRRMLALARAATSPLPRNAGSPAGRLRCRLARALVALARRLDPDPGLLQRRGGTPSRV